MMADNDGLCGLPDGLMIKLMEEFKVVYLMSSDLLKAIYGCEKIIYTMEI